jgi:multiple sugar transport system permease protein
MSNGDRVQAIHQMHSDSMLRRTRHAPMGVLAKRRERWFYLLVSPWLIGFLLFQALPLLGALLLSVTEWPLPQPPAFVGLDHFQAMAADHLFGRTLFNTAYYALGTVPAGLLLGLILALLVNRRRWGMRFFRTIFFVPAVISGVATILLWGWIFNPRYGLVNAALALVGVRGPGWLQDEAWAMPALILMSLWTVGTNMVVFVAALQGIPRDLYEAAELDGAGEWPRLRHVTWPLISPVTFFLLIVNLVAAFQVFTPTYVLTRGGPNNATLTLPLYIYLNAFAWGRLGYASALAMVLFLSVLLLTFVQFRLADRWVFYASGER